MNLWKLTIDKIQKKAYSGFLSKQYEKFIQGKVRDLYCFWKKIQTPASSRKSTSTSANHQFRSKNNSRKKKTIRRVWKKFPHDRSKTSSRKSRIYAVTRTDRVKKFSKVPEVRKSKLRAKLVSKRLCYGSTVNEFGLSDELRAHWRRLKL